jgi:hypothetical protein
VVRDSVKREQLVKTECKKEHGVFEKLPDSVEALSFPH